MDTRRDWNTPISGWVYPGFLKLESDLDVMKFVVQDQGKHGSGEIYRFEWREFCAFRSTLEEHRYPWLKLAKDPCSSAPTHIIADSSWIDQLRTEGGLLDSIYPDAQHYAIYTTSFWIEVISNREPKIVRGDA